MCVFLSSVRPPHVLYPLSLPFTFLFFYNEPATTAIYTLSLHDALPICGFLLQHSMQGWCPPLKLLRRSGCRTAREIETERYALQAFKSNGKAWDQEKTHGNGRHSKESGEAAQSS